jgi:hypothetical protein
LECETAPNIVAPIHIVADKAGRGFPKIAAEGPLAGVRVGAILHPGKIVQNHDLFLLDA